MLTIYYKPHPKRTREAAFHDALLKQFSDAVWRKENYLIPSAYLEKVVDAHQLIAWLEAETLLPSKKRQQCIQMLKGGPQQLKVAVQVSRISFDIVVVADERAYYWEFHEEQHRKLTVARKSKVYTLDGTAVEMPRYLQRLVRDVWRTLYFRPYTIVWSDWFEASAATYHVALSDGFQEFYKVGSFSFRRFCHISQ
jgi:hypothetical protein